MDHSNGQRRAMRRYMSPVKAKTCCRGRTCPGPKLNQRVQRKAPYCIWDWWTNSTSYSYRIWKGMLYYKYLLLSLTLLSTDKHNTWRFSTNSPSIVTWQIWPWCLQNYIYCSHVLQTQCQSWRTHRWHSNDKTANFWDANYNDDPQKIMMSLRAKWPRHRTST